MKYSRCLYCYDLLQPEETDFHSACSRKFFGTPEPPILDYSNEQMQELAGEIVLRSVAVTGVQAKLSLTIEKDANDPKKSRFTIVGLWGNYILKPPAETFPFLPENEDVTMHLSAAFRIRTAEHSLIRLKSGELAYLTKRFDREDGSKLALEDMCQLTETMTADKYRGSMEKIGKQIEKHSMIPGLDAITLFDLAIISFLTGNADMHLKNFSLLTSAKRETTLSPAYDLVCTKLAMPDDAEEMALTLNGKRRKLTKGDFDNFAKNLKISEKVKEFSYGKFGRYMQEALEWINNSFLPATSKEEYKQLVRERWERLQ